MLLIIETQNFKEYKIVQSYLTPFGRFNLPIVLNKSKLMALLKVLKIGFYTSFFQTPFKNIKEAFLIYKLLTIMDNKMIMRLKYDIKTDEQEIDNKIVAKNQVTVYNNYKSLNN